MVSNLIQPESPPLSVDADGAIRVGTSRVLLEIVLRSFQDGATPEAIAQRYPSATLSDVYSVIAHYLRHRADLDAYLATREQRADAVRHQIEAHQGDLAELRRRLLASRV
jgi:uncharacterized protein (DUF433 family)